jgi:tetratricopeptide (TPR) repeat protein
MFLDRLFPHSIGRLIACAAVFALIAIAARVDAQTRPDPPLDCRAFVRPADHASCERANSGDADAEVATAEAFVIGKDVSRNNAEALRLYRLAADQGNAEGMNGAAWRLAVDGGDLGEALALAARAAALEPANAAIEDTIGWILFHQNRFQLALFHAQRAVALEPRCPSCEDHLGDILAALGRRADAREHWRRALELSPDGSSDPDWDRAAVEVKLGAR